MKKITVHRKWQLANAWMPHWVVLGMSRSDFMEKFHLPDARSCKIDALGYPVKRMEFDPNDYGVPVGNGKMLVIEANDDAASVFAVTFDGLLSNELLLPRSQTAYKIELTTKGGWRQPGYPQLELLE